MAAALRISLRAARPSLVAPRAAQHQVRFLNSATAPVLYSAHARVVGARTGHIEGDDLNIDLTSKAPFLLSAVPVLYTHLVAFQEQVLGCMSRLQDSFLCYTPVNTYFPFEFSPSPRIEELPRRHTFPPPGRHHHHPSQQPANLPSHPSVAKSLGGTGDKGKTNPEELFAAGFGACFQSAMNASAPSLGIRMPSKKEDSVVDATVHLVGDMKKLDMGIRVDLKVRVRGLDRAEVEKVVAKAEEVCPYSRATRGNVETKIEIVDEL